MARRVDVRRTGGSGRRVAALVCLAGLAAVALIGILHPPTVAGAAQPSATDALGAASGVGSVWASGGASGGLNWPDLITKGVIVLALLFITLRVLGRVGGGTTKHGGRMEVLESRTIAPKASLHLVAIGERRLVVGLTPSGMVSIAELDAAELESEAGAAAAAEDVATAAADRAGRATTGSTAGASAGSPWPAGSALGSLLAPLDGLTGRVVMFLNGGRVR
jgi:flagellar biosynthetic protein FliO